MAWILQQQVNTACLVATSLATPLANITSSSSASTSSSVRFATAPNATAPNATACSAVVPATPNGTCNSPKPSCRASLVSAVFRDHFQNPTTLTPLAFRKDAATMLPDRPQQSRSQVCFPTASVDAA
ncbi:hypothetical protein ACSS6W_002195 [Trichoderma asperelloides]